MIGTLPRAFIIAFSIIATLFFLTVFATIPDFFQHLISAKQWRVEQAALIGTVFLMPSFVLFRHLRVSLVDAGVLAYFFLSFFQEIAFGSGYIEFQQFFFQTIMWAAIYLFFRRYASDPRSIYIVSFVFMVTAVLQCCLGFSQLYGFHPSFHSLFKITGTFHNPGPFSGFVVSALPLAIAGYQMGYTKGHGGDTEIHREVFLRGIKINFNSQKIFHGIFKGVSLLTIITVLLVVPAAQSRAAWVAGGIGSIYVLWSCKERFPFITRLSVRVKRLSKTLRVLLIAGSIILLLGATTGIYLLKKDSANGRLLIWQVTSQLIKDRPVIGHGSGVFSTLYMDEQAQWFKSGKGTEEQAMIAGSPESPFNEPLRLWLEKGLIGVLLAGGILGFILFLPTPPNPLKGEPQTRIAKTLNPQLKTQNQELETLQHGLKGTLIAILTFSLFSYPFDISSFTLQLVVIVALLSSTTPLLTIIKGRRTLLLTIPLVVMLIAAGVWYFPKRQAHYAALKTWRQANQFYSMRSYNIALETYEEAFPVLKTNGLFLQMYGKALSMDEQYKKSNEILALAQKYYSSYIIQNTLGDNHKALGNYDKAETAYRKSSNMVPGLLLPKYLLAKLYNESGETRKAQQAAREILNSPVKVESTATHEIMNEMRNILTLKPT